MNLNNLNKKVLHSYTYGKLDLLSHELRKNLDEIIKKIGNLNDKIERLDEKVNNSDSRAIEVVNKKLDVVEKPGNRSNLIPGILAVIVLLVGTTFIEDDGGLKGIVFFALIAPLVLLFSKIFSGSNEEKQKEYERYQKKYERLISIEKNKFKSSKYFKEILINKNKLDVLWKKKLKLITF